MYLLLLYHEILSSGKGFNIFCSVAVGICEHSATRLVRSGIGCSQCSVVFSGVESRVRALCRTLQFFHYNIRKPSWTCWNCFGPLSSSEGNL